MQLVDRDLIRLDAPVRDYLPDFALADPRSAAITIGTFGGAWVASDPPCVRLVSTAT